MVGIGLDLVLTCHVSDARCPACLWFQTRLEATHPEPFPQHAVEGKVVLPGALCLLDVAQGGQGLPECASVGLPVLQTEHGVCLQLLLLLMLCKGGSEAGPSGTHLRLRVRVRLRVRQGWLWGCLKCSPVVSTCSLSAMSQRSSLRWAPLTIT